MNKKHKPGVNKKQHVNGKDMEGQHAEVVKVDGLVKPEVKQVSECCVCGNRSYHSGTMTEKVLKRGLYCSNCQTRRVYNFVPPEKWGDDPMLEVR